MDASRSSAAFAVESRNKTAMRQGKHSTQSLENLGPATYQPEKHGRRALGGASVFRSHVPRSGVNEFEGAPGPGTYESTSHLISRSHNITVGQ